MSVAARTPSKKRWKPNKFFATKFWDVNTCSGVAFHEGWQFEIYRWLGMFFDDPALAERDADSQGYAINVENINPENREKYLRFYATKMDWLVKQWCIYNGGGSKECLRSRYSNPPQPDVSELDPAKIMFFVWLTNNTADIPNPHFKNKTAPNPDNYHEETGASAEESSRLLSECNV